MRIVLTPLHGSLILSGVGPLETLLSYGRCWNTAGLQQEHGFFARRMGAVGPLLNAEQASLVSKVNPMVP